mgnify:CR=1 FL=1
MKYLSRRTFQVWVYTVSHSCLFLRSNKAQEEGQYFDDPNKTIDVEFWDVAYMELVTNFHGLAIERVENNVPLRFSNFLLQGSSLYRITCQSGEFYVIAGGCKIGTSNMTYDQHRSTNLLLEYDESFQL